MASVNPDYPLNQPTGNIYLDSLIWGGSWSDGLGGTTHVSWSASVGQLYDEQPDVVGDGWLNFELNALKNALKTWSNVANITFTQVPTYAQSNIQYYNISNSHMQKIYDAGFGQVLGFHEVPDSAGTEPLYGVLNHDGVGWTKLGLQVGGMGFNTLVHEIGHGLGLAHPHDDGGGSSVFPGVNSPFASYGTHDLNQGVFTIMSYNDGWIKQPSPLIDVSYGLAATPMAFDIAAIQLIYGANMHYNTGNNLYFLPKFNGSGAYWSCIWDAGGKDTISANGTHGNATINLNAAPLVGENAGGYISHVDGIVGGFTIANNVVIENAIGGNGHDQIIGNQADNYLVGGKGNDVLNGGAGTDKMSGGFGNDIYFVDQLLDRVVEPSRLAGEADEVRASITYTLGAYLEHLTLIGNGNHNGTGNNASNILKGDGTNNALYGRAANDTLEGGGGSDTLDGGSGGDRLTGGQGDDVYYIDHKNDLVIEATNQGVDLIRTTISYNLTLNPNVENLILLGKSNLNATGNSLDNELTGNTSKNTLNGGIGKSTSSDTMVGGGGNDVYIVNHKRDVIVELNKEGIDLVLSRANYTLSDNVENITLTDGSKNGGYANTSATGNSLNNIIKGNAGNNTLNGAAGADKMIGGKGDDTYYVDYVRDIVFERVSEGKDEVHSTIDYALGANIEELFLIGEAIKGTGNHLNNFISGNHLNNILSGGAGNDEILGGLEQDTLTGGSGADTFVFRATEESLFGYTADLITDFKVKELDRIDLTYIDANTLLSGNNAFNFIGNALFSGVAGELRFDVQTHSVLGDTNGDGIAELQIQLAGVTSLQSVNIFL